MEALRLVFKKLKEVGVKLNPSKCQLGQSEVPFLGHVISAAGVATDSSKIRAVMDFPTPNTAKIVRSFVGLASYYRRFVKDFATITKPFNGILTLVHQRDQEDRHKGEKKPLGTLWTSKCQQAFMSLKMT